MNQYETERATILIVDDNPENIRILQQILTIQGYRTRPAIRGEFALHVVRSTPPALILLDILMSGIDGFEVCRQLKADDRLKEIPVIFLSALGETSDKMKAFALGGVDYITKPFQVEEVLARVRTHLSLRQAQQQFEAKNQQFQAEIIERQHTQAALQESETRYRFIVDNSSDFITKIDRHSMMVFVTEVSRNFVGYAPEEMMNTSCFEYIHPDDHARIAQALQDVLETGVESAAEFRAKRKDGSYFWVESTGKQAFNAAGEPEAIVIHRNISERKQAEEALRQSEERYQQMINLSPDAVLVHINDKLVFANPAAVRLFSVSDARDLLGQSTLALLHPDDLPIIIERRQIAMAGQIISNQMDIRVRRSDEVFVDAALTSFVLTYQGQLAIQATLRDITERKKMEDRLRQSEEYHRNLLNLFPDGLTIIDLDGRLTYISPKSSMIYGVPPELNVIGTSAFDWFEFTDHDRLRERFQQFTAKQIAPPAEYRAHKYDGNLFWIELSSAPLTNAQGQVTGIMTITRDITSRKQTEEVLQQTQKAAEVANRAQSAFLANIYSR